MFKKKKKDVFFLSTYASVKLATRPRVLRNTPTLLSDQPRALSDVDVRWSGAEELRFGFDNHTASQLLLSDR